MSRQPERPPRLDRVGYYLETCDQVDDDDDYCDYDDSEPLAPTNISAGAL
jgi:hypothetical protein